MPLAVRTVNEVSRSFVATGLLLAALVLTACTGGGPDPTRSRTPAYDLRARLVSALRDDSPALADLAEDGRTSLTPMDPTWLPGWRIVDVVSSTPPHPRRFFAALPDDEGRAAVLTGAPERFSMLLTDAGVRVESAEVAIGVGTTFSTRPGTSGRTRTGSTVWPTPSGGRS